MRTVLLLIAAIVSNASANVLLKIGSVKMQEIKGSLEFLNAIVRNGYVWAGLINFALAFILYAKILTSMKLSIAYPIMTSAGFIIVSVASVFLLKEDFSLLRILGLLIVAIGIWLIFVS